jgi:prepilin-type N-terminal cleavage/methylation domain-containing protein
MARFASSPSVGASVRQPARRGFTLLELLIVAAIIGILLSLLMATVSTVWEVAYDTQCRHNLSQLHKAFYQGPDAALPNPIYWVGFIEKMGAAQALLCPNGGSAQMEGVSPTREPSPPPPPEDYEPPVDTTPPPPYDPDPEQDAVAMDPPASVVFNHLESNSIIREFCEQKDFVLPSSVSTNLSSPGYYDSRSKITPGSVSAGQRVNCYFLHFDPVKSGPAESSGQLNFSGKILGVICLDGDLDATDRVLGNPGTAYPTGQKSRGFEFGAEIVSLSDDMHSFTMHRFKSSFPGEQVRILVEAKSKDNAGGGGAWGTWSGGSGDWTWDMGDDYGPGGPTSYGMNKFATDWNACPGQILLVEYDRALVDISLGGSACNGVLRKHFAPRHRGRLNVLFVEGNVESLTPDDLLPEPDGDPWRGRTKR